MNIWPECPKCAKVIPYRYAFIGTGDVFSREKCSAMMKIPKSNLSTALAAFLLLWTVASRFEDSFVKFSLVVAIGIIGTAIEFLLISPRLIEEKDSGASSRE